MNDENKTTSPPRGTSVQNKLTVQRNVRHCEEHEVRRGNPVKLMCCEAAQNIVLLFRRAPAVLALFLLDCRVALRAPRNDVRFYFKSFSRFCRVKQRISYLTDFFKYLFWTLVPPRCFCFHHS